MTPPVSIERKNLNLPRMREAHPCLLLANFLRDLIGLACKSFAVIGYY
jgi:hypothetical protein